MYIDVRNVKNSSKSKKACPERRKRNFARTAGGAANGFLPFRGLIKRTGKQTSAERAVSITAKAAAAPANAAWIDLQTALHVF